MTKKKTETKKAETKSTAKERVEVELNELSDKIYALIDFKTSKKYYALSKTAQRLVRIQLLDMTHYADILKQRLRIW